VSAPVFAGRFVRLEPLGPEHAEDIQQAVFNEDVFARAAYMVDPPPEEEAARAAWFSGKIDWSGRTYFACVDARSGQARGFLAFMRDEPAHRTVEIGDVLFGSGVSRTPAGTEAVYLLLRHAFESMNYRRVEWKCDTRNHASYRAAERFGFTFEGVFRQHMIVRGQSRDSAWLSMLDGEWPARRSAFERWLSPANFDEQGAQRSRLNTLHAR
jgi:RimJ/RimL family protein N-acetyltransferase